jgi:hypothetical protein
MSKENVLYEIEAPMVERVTNQTILLGKPIPAIDRLKLFSPAEYEMFIQEWLFGFLKNKYQKVRRSGGAGDKGRDVIAYKKFNINNAELKWDNYQCKHYNRPLMPSNIWVELGKLCFYTHRQDFTVPNKYFFVAPHGVGSSLGDLLENPEDLKKDLIKNWDKYCKTEITKGQIIELKGRFEQYVKNFDFSIMGYIDPLEIIEQHQQTRYHIPRFGGGLNKARPINIVTPTEITNIEMNYVNKLLQAYSDHAKKQIDTLDKLQEFSNYISHFNRQREHFYLAESLHKFERDTLPEGTNGFKELKNEIFDGVIDIVESNFKDGFEKVKKVTQEARKLEITSNVLISVLTGNDRSGICHHLANEDKIDWV